MDAALGFFRQTYETKFSTKAHNFFDTLYPTTDHTFRLRYSVTWLGMGYSELDTAYLSE
jgi:hypothetical protein